MSSYPGRNHTRRGIASARAVPLCQKGYPPGLGVPDPCCPCDACQRYFAAEERRYKGWSSGRGME